MCDCFSSFWLILSENMLSTTFAPASCITPLPLSCNTTPLYPTAVLLCTLSRLLHYPICVTQFCPTCCITPTLHSIPVNALPHSIPALVLPNSDPAIPLLSSILLHDLSLSQFQHYCTLSHSISVVALPHTIPVVILLLYPRCDSPLYPDCSITPTLSKLYRSCME